MEFRRSGGRDERRRRVLLDEPNGNADQSPGTAATKTSATEGATSARSAPDYAEAARAVRQLRLSDLVPRKAWLVAALTALATLLAGGILAAAWYAPAWSWLDQPAREMFSAAAPGNLASWFSSMLLLLSAAGALQIYLLRRHKVDDYRGRYRLWIPVAGLLLLASADAVVGLHRLLGLALSTLLPAAWTPSTELAWMLSFGALIAAVGIRLAIETRRSYGTLTALGLCSLAYLASAVLHCRPESISLAGTSDPRAAVTIGLATQLAGHLLLLLAVMLYGRYVFLAANGLLKVRQPRPKKQKVRRQQAETAEDSSTSRSTQEKKPAAAKPAASSAAKQAPAATAPKASISKQSVAASSSGEDDDSEPATLSMEELAAKDDLSPTDTAHLSKAERRRLRKLQKRSNRAA